MSFSMDHEYRVILLYPVLEVGLHLYSAFGLIAFTVRVIWAWDRSSRPALLEARLSSIG